MSLVFVVQAPWFSAEVELMLLEMEAGGVSFSVSLAGIVLWRWRSEVPMYPVFGILIPYNDGSYAMNRHSIKGAGLSLSTNFYQTISPNLFSFSPGIWSIFERR